MSAMTHLGADSDRVVRDAVDAYLEGRARPDIDGEAVFETRNSEYRLIDGVLFSCTDSTLIGAELVGWLTETLEGATVTRRWRPGARAVLVDRRHGRHIVVTSGTKLLRLDGSVGRGSAVAQTGSGAIQAVLTGRPLRPPSPPPLSPRQEPRPSPGRMQAPTPHGMTRTGVPTAALRAGPTPVARPAPAVPPGAGRVASAGRPIPPIHPPPRPVRAPAPPPSPLPAFGGAAGVKALPYPSPPPYPTPPPGRDAPLPRFATALEPSSHGPAEDGAPTERRSRPEPRLRGAPPPLPIPQRAPADIPPAPPSAEPFPLQRPLQRGIVLR